MVLGELVDPAKHVGEVGEVVVVPVGFRVAA